MDLDALDLSKENIQPLRRGRNLSVLSTALMAQTDTDVHQQLMKERDQYEILIRSYEGDDPLQHWYDYVLWVEQHFPKQGKEGNLQTLLERCLEKFKDTTEYSQDVRYIDLWIRFMSFVKDPLSLYKQVFSHGIGTECAFFYVCWAEEFENANDPKRADQIYLKGIQKMAQPIEELQRAHVDFQLRIARHVLSNGCQKQEEISGEKRSTLATLRAHGRRKNLVSNARTGSTIHHHRPGVLPPSGGRYTEKGSNNSKISIYQDEAVLNADPAIEPILKDPIFITQEIDKENTKNAGRWNEGKVKIKTKPYRTGVPSVATSTRVSAFRVHEDECCDTPKVPQSDIGVSNILKARRTDFNDEVKIPIAIFEPHDERKKAVYPKHKVYSGGTEFSLEELRAIRYLNLISKNEKMDKRSYKTRFKYEDLQSQRKEDAQLTSREAEHGSFSTDCSSYHVDTESTASEACKKLSFPVFVDHEDYLNTLMELKQKTSHSKMKEKLLRDNGDSCSIADDTESLNFPVICVDVKKTSEVKSKPCKKLSFSVFVDNEDDLNDTLKPKQKTSHPEEKLSNNNDNNYGSANISYGSGPSSLPTPNVDVENASSNINFERSQTPQFSIYVDTEEDMNALLKSKQETNRQDVKPRPLPSDNIFELRKEEFKRGKLPGSFLKVPFLPCRQKAGSKAPAEKEHDQSLTVHTREAWTMMQDLFKSPSVNMKMKKDLTLAQAAKGSPRVDRNSMIAPQNPLLTPKITPFKIFNESSATQFEDECVSLPSHPSQILENKKNHQNHIPTKATSTVTSENTDDKYSINMANCSEKEILPNVADQNRPPALAMNVFCDLSTNDFKDSEMPQAIPYIPSPGMTHAQKRLLIGTENKENMMGGKRHSTSSSRKSLVGVLEPAKIAYFMTMDEQIQTEEKQEETEDSNETCCTAAFAHPLFTSTPFLKSQPNSDEKRSAEFDNTVTAFSGTSLTTHAKASSRKNDESSKDKLKTEIGKTYILDSKTSHIYEPVSAKHLSVIQEVAEEKSSGSSGRSRNSIDEHACSPHDSVHPFPAVTSDSVDMEERFSVINQGRSNTKEEELKHFKEECLKVLQFPTSKYELYFRRIAVEFVLDTTMFIDGETYVIDNMHNRSLRDFKTFQAWECESNDLVTLEIYPHIDPWDFYIRKEIYFRLSDRTMIQHFLDASKALCFSDKLVVVSHSIKNAPFYDVLIQYKGETNSDLSEEDIMYLTLEVIKIVHHMHNCSIVHGNLSWKTFLISYAANDVVLTVYSFKAAVDVSLLYSRGKSDLYQNDYRDVADMVHGLLFKKPLDNKADIANSVEHNLPKSYKKDVWMKVFCELLKGGKPDVERIQGILNNSNRHSDFRSYLINEF